MSYIGVSNQLQKGWSSRISVVLGGKGGIPMVNILIRESSRGENKFLSGEGDR